MPEYPGFRRNDGLAAFTSGPPAPTCLPMTPDLAILYEHPTWFEPLFAALDRRGVR